MTVAHCVVAALVLITGLLAIDSDCPVVETPWDDQRDHARIS